MKIKICLLFVLFLVMARQPLLAQGVTQHKYDILNYDFFAPSPNDPAKKYPLITYFHGYNDTVKKNFNWYNSSVQSVNPCFVFAPKCPPSDGEGWGNSWQGIFSTRMGLAFEVLDSLVKNYNIDTNRLYIYGTSMGGYGTYNVLYTYPGKFAAAMVLCGGGNPVIASEVMKTPLWIFHGTADQSVNISESKNIYELMLTLGAKKVRFTEYPGVGHEMWNYAPYEKAWPDWIFNFSKGDTFSQRPNRSISISCAKGTTAQVSIKVSWNKVDSHQVRENKIWYYKIIRNDSVIATPNFTLTSYIDQTPKTGVNAYKMVAVNYDFLESDTSNTSTVDLTVGITENEKLLPQEFALLQNYPNPFNPTTTIQYSLPQSLQVKLTVYNLLGAKVRMLVNEYQEAGGQAAVWNARDDRSMPVSSGIYFYRLEAGGKSSQKKMILMK